MFWTYQPQSTSEVETILDKEDVTLTEILQEENVIQECKSRNRKLLDL